MVVTVDEAPGKLDVDRLRQLRPAFPLAGGGGTVTAGNASPITDGAAALVLMSASKAASLGMKVPLLTSYQPMPSAKEIYHVCQNSNNAIFFLS